MAHGDPKKLDPWIVTVPHTGTFFIDGLLRQMGIPFVQSHVYRQIARDRIEIQGRPCIVTLRDPMMAVIGKINRGDTYRADLWRSVARWVDLPHVLIFKVDCPVDERAAQIAALQAFVGSEITPRTDWAPVNTFADTRELKAPYGRGERPALLQAAFEELRGYPDVVQLFVDHGYDLSWMRRG